MQKPKISIVIPYHDSPLTAFFLGRLLNSIHAQSFKDYEIILTKEGKMAENTNAAMQKAKGELIKIMYSDDYFAHPDALKVIVDSFTEETQWLATGCLHQQVGTGYVTPHSPHIPSYSDDIETGHNTIGSPSVITVRNEGKLFFDEELSFLLDCDLYKRYYQKYGLPAIIEDMNVVIGLHDEQVSNTMSQKDKLQEFKYMQNKYE